MKKLIRRKQWYDNSLDAYNPELWARESLEILEENMVLGSLVYRDFENEIQEYGDVVNTRLPGAFTASRKGDSDNVTVQDATATNIPILLNQHVHTSFLLKDRQMSLGFKSLVEEFLQPAVLSVAQFIDLVLSTQSYQFLGNSVGQLGTVSSSNVKGYLLDARQKAFNNKLPSNRAMIWTGSAEKAALDLDLFVSAEKVGDEGTALREGSLGRKFGFSNFACQNQPEVTNSTPTRTGAINKGGGYPAGTVTTLVDGITGAIGVGSYITIAGDGIPHRVSATVGGATPSSITFAPALANPVADNAVVTLYTPGAVSLGAGYAAGWYKAITVDATASAPQVGQGIAFGAPAATAVYGIVDVNHIGGDVYSLTLDRPLEAAIANDDAVNYLPAGSYSLGFTPQAIALVTRPLDLAPTQMGAMSYVANAYGLSMRVTMTYDGNKQGILTTVDTLIGVKTLDANRGIVMLG